MSGQDTRTVLLRRTYRGHIDDVWDAITDPERISRWFLPVTGDLRVGGHYQTEGNAGGEILHCEPPRLLRVTWVFGEVSPDDVNEVEIRLTPGGEDETHFELEHVATVDDERWAQYGPGAVGVGWELALLGLALHLEGGDIPAEEREAWGMSPQARAFMTRSAAAWGEAHQAGGATEAEATAAAAATTAFYAPEPSEDQSGQ